MFPFCVLFDDTDVAEFVCHVSSYSVTEVGDLGVLPMQHILALRTGSSSQRLYVYIIVTDFG